MRTSRGIKKPQRIFIQKELTTKVIMDCRTTAAHKFGTRLGFKQDYVMLAKEQSVPTKINSSFNRENMQTQYSVFVYNIDLYFHDYKLTTEIDENSHSDRNTDYETKRNLVVSLLELILKKKTLIFLKPSLKYLGTSNHHLIN